MTSPYAKLLSSKRCRDSEIDDRKLVLESESDRSRIVFSAPFRRLQQKAQVFSLEANAAVRSRLTHSLEVAQIGRFLADQIVKSLRSKKMLNEEQARSFINFVETACLMHDLGNPPFGHFGEAAIADWFRENGREAIVTALAFNEERMTRSQQGCVDKALADFREFDGNCQGLRIAALLQWKDDHHGLNLTYTALASYLKYIRPPILESDDAEVKKKPFQKKAGFFYTEQALIEAIWSHFGYDTNHPQRFPLAYVMEAADDIAYCISDLEDSIEKDLLQARDVFPMLLKTWRSQIRKCKLASSTDATAILKMLKTAAISKKTNSATFTDFRTSLSRLMTSIASRNYIRNHKRILDGTAHSLISETSAEGYALEMLKDFCRYNVYRHVTVQRTELSGLTAIKGLLNHFGVLLNCSDKRFMAALKNANKDDQDLPIIFEKKLLSLFPEKHLLAFRHSLKVIEANGHPIEVKECAKWNARAHLITDFISGMTDDFSLATYQMLSGIKVDSK